MPTLFLPIERNEWSRDKDGIPFTSKHEDESKTYDLDFTNQLDSAETISSIVVTPSGVTVSSSSITSGLGGATRAVRLTVTGADGYVEVKATTSTSRVLVQTVRFMGVPPRAESDY